MNTIGIDLGGTQIKAVLVDSAGNVLRRELRATEDCAAGRQWAESMRSLAEELGHTLPVGVSAPGLVAGDSRTIAHMPGRLQGLEGLDWTELFQRKALVPVTNDAHASLIGEAWAGAAVGLRDCFMLTLGTGVGGAVLCDGRILRGRHGRAGHLGHICLDVQGVPDIVGTPGSLEDAIGNHRIVERSNGRFTTTHELIAAFRNGDPDGIRIWSASIRALACGIASLINVLDPEAVIIGGGIAQAGDALFGPLAVELESIEWRLAGTGVRLIPAALGEWAGAIGAARSALLARGVATPGAL